MKRLEFCDVCGAATGKAGKGEDSLYLETGAGPFCRGCFDTLTCAITAALAEAAAEHAKALRAAVEAERAECSAIAQRFGDPEIRDAILDRGKP